MIKKRVHLKISYKIYNEHKELIDGLIKSGYSIALELDDTFDLNFSCFVLFSYIFVYEKYDYYDMIVDDDSISKNNLVVL